MAGGKDWAQRARAGLADFEALAAAAWQRLPHEFRDLCGDVVIRVEDFADRGGAARSEARQPLRPDGPLPGRQPRQEQRHGPAARARHGLPLPSRLLDYWAEGEETLGDLVTHVLVHEIGHHFGFSDADMDAHRGRCRRRLRNGRGMLTGLRNNRLPRRPRTGECARQARVESGIMRGFFSLRGTRFRGIARRLRCGWPCRAACGSALAPAQAGPTPEEYVAHVGGDAKIVPAGQLKLDGRKLFAASGPPFSTISSTTTAPPIRASSSSIRGC